MCNRPNGLQLEHEVEGCNLERANVSHAQHLRHMLDRRTGQPPLLLLRAPQKRNDG